MDSVRVIEGFELFYSLGGILTNTMRRVVEVFELFSSPCGVLTNMMLWWDLGSVRAIERNSSQHDALVGLGLCSGYRAEFSST
jgi:hypothetical protein